jgi:hypothetical protein
MTLTPIQAGTPVASSRSNCSSKSSASDLRALRKRANVAPVSDHALDDAGCDAWRVVAVSTDPTTHAVEEHDLGAERHAVEAHELSALGHQSEEWV